jgi:hypothetical protein
LVSQPTHLENKKQEDTIKRTLTLRLIVRGSWEHLDTEVELKPNLGSKCCDFFADAAFLKC